MDILIYITQQEKEEQNKLGTVVERSGAGSIHRLIGTEATSSGHNK